MRNASCIVFVDVMNAQYLVLDDPFNCVEQPPAEKERSGQKLVGSEEVTPVSRPPQNEQTDHHEHICAAMKEAIPNRVEFQAGHVDYRIPITQHVVH